VASELEVQVGARESQVLRQEGRISGHGAFGGMEEGDEMAAGRTDVGMVGDVSFVEVVTSTEARVVGGASVLLVHTVAVEVTAVSVRVKEVVMMVMEFETPVMVTGHKVVVVKTISDVTMSDAAGTEDDGAGVKPGRI